jgi:hypothetical protein
MLAMLLAGTLPSAFSAAPAPQGGGPSQTVDGQVTSTACGSSTCATTAGQYSSVSLTYSSGVFSGTITTNGCPSYVSTFTQATASCIQQTFPAGSAYQNIGAAGKAAGLLGRVGLSLKGMNIYGPLEAGFSSTSGPTVCSTSGYYCTAGMDVAACIQELYWTCGTAQKSAVDTTVAGTTFGDSCGGHADAYHYHVDLKCEYTPNGSQSPGNVHSPLVGIALDGRGIYGVWEGNNAAPSLDACNGHVGTVPGTYSANAGAANTYVNSITGMPTIPSTQVYVRALVMHVACGPARAYARAVRSAALSPVEHVPVHARLLCEPEYDQRELPRTVPRNQRGAGWLRHVHASHLCQRQHIFLRQLVPLRQHRRGGGRRPGVRHRRSARCLGLPVLQHC